MDSPTPHAALIHIDCQARMYIHEHTFTRQLTAAIYLLCIAGRYQEYIL